ncbi:MAG: glycosyl hydrolase family 43 [Lentisphaerae bacterium]|nr:glycosyl hydrolase family 43 [Lentisphaerota bacterium]
MRNLCSMHPGQVWHDNDGKPIQAHGGGVLSYNGSYYWYGENKDAPNVPGTQRVEVIGMSCYSSRDLLNWTNEGVVLPAVKDDPGCDLHPGRVVERPKVIHNTRTGKFVMWMHIDDINYQYARAGVAIADRPQGPFTYLESVRPCGADSRDLTVFQDDDGAAYLVTGVLWHSAIQIVRLSDDYLRPDGASVRVLQRPGPPAGRESPAVFKRRGRYYLVSSGTTGWDPNVAEYAVADRMLGEWTTRGNPCAGPDAEITFHAQNTHVLPVAGRDDAFIVMFDRWNPNNLQDSRYVWLPAEFSREGDLRIPWRDSWNMDIFGG